MNTLRALVGWGALALLVADGGSVAVAAKSKDDAKRRPVKENAEAKRLEQEAAEQARKDRESRVPEVVKEMDRKKAEEAASGPHLSAAEFKRRETESKVQKKRDEQIDTLRKIIELGPPPEEKPALLFQLAELYWENSQHFFFQGMGMDDEIFAAREAGDGKKEQSLTKQKEEHLDKSRMWAEASNKAYEEIIKKHKKFDRMDEVLYGLGQSFWDAGKQKEALDVYRRLIQEHPKSKYVPDAYLALGEYSFSIKNVQAALGAYKKAASFEESTVVGYAIYKMGWCYYNLGDWAEAADKFKEVILLAELDKEKLGSKKVMLTKEARKDYVTVYSHFGQPERAMEDFKELATGEEYRAMVERLAGLFFSEGQDREAAVVYLMMINAFPDNTRNPFFQGRIVTCTAKKGNKRQVVKHARKLVEEFQRVRLYTEKLDPKDPARAKVENDTRDAEELADNTIRSLATQWHNEARKTRDDETYEMAYELYGDYLDLFPDKKAAYDMRFFYSELNYKLERYEKAGEEYTKVLLMDPKGRWAEAASEEAVRAYDELVQEFDKKAKKDAQPADYDPNKPLPIPDIKKKYVAACANYLKYYPEGRIYIEVTYKIARVMYDYNVFDKAVELFMKVVRGNSEHPRAEQAASLVLDVHNIREDWEALYNAAREFQQNKVLMKRDEFAKTTNEVLEAASFKVVAKLQRQGKYEEAAKRYLAFADEFRKSALADKALANAAANFTLAGLTDEAVQTRQLLINRFPDSPLVPDSLYAVAEAYEAVAELDRAADALEQFYHKYPKDARAKDALFNAGIYREGYGGKNIQAAVTDRELYLKDFSKAKDAAAVAYSLGRLHEQAKQYQKAREAYDSYALKYGKEDAQKAWEARFRAADLLKNTAGQRAADDAIEKLALEYKKKFNKKLPESSNVSARVAFMDAEVEYAQFRNIKIDNPDLKNMKKFQKSIGDKAQGRDKMRETFRGVVKLKDPEYAIAALYRIGDLNLHYMNSIQGVPPPKELNSEQKEIFREKLAEKALPIEEEAVGAFKLCVQKSQELHVFNQWTGKCLDVLEEKRSEEYPRVSISKTPSPAHLGTPMPEYLVLDLPKDGGDLISLPVPPPALAPKAAPAAEAQGDAAGAPGGAGGGQ